MLDQSSKLFFCSDKEAAKFDLHYFCLRHRNCVKICRTSLVGKLTKINISFLEQNRKEISDRKILNGCLQSV